MAIEVSVGDLEKTATRLTGLADAVSAWVPFKVDLLAGQSRNGKKKVFVMLKDESRFRGPENC